MLGWFKKKFKKQEPVAPAEEAVVEELDTDTLPPEQEHVEEAVAPETGKPLSLPEEEEQGAGEPTPSKIPDQAAHEEAVPEAEKEPVPVQEKEITPDAAAEATPAAIADEAEKPIKIIKKSEQESQSGTQKKSLFTRLTEKLGKTRETFTYQLDALFLGKKEIDADMLDELEEILITADLGVGTTLELLESARRKVKRKELYDPKSLKETLKVQIKNLITANDQDATLVMPKKGPFVIMVIGVNGVGKTTTIGKIAKKFQQAGSSVMLVAGDTFRAAAVSQLKIWGERSNVPVIAHQEGADPSSVVFDALGIAQAQNIDVVLVDTAGRMHTKDNLMEELKKIKRVMGKKLKGAPHEVMLVIDATTGQNGISQARLFDDAVGVTGITLTKLDGTSKGGIVANICKEMKIPIRFIGIGEKMTDLRDFDAVEFVDALFHSSNNRSE
jgi:fused signal recognition particle receptor